MILRNSARRYSTSETDPTQDLVKPAASNVSTKRRALGDITNAYPEESKINATKKPILSVVPSQSSEATASSDNVDVTSSSMVEYQDARSYMQRPADDIDARDVENPVLATVYVNEMYDHFLALEKEFLCRSNYMSDQQFVNEKMRAILVDWLVEVHLKFKMVPETLYLTVNLIDRYLDIRQVRRSRLQLVGVAALLLAAKYEEIYPPELRDLVYITDKAYNKQEILEMETDIVNALHYQLTVPTAHTFLCRYLKAAHADRTMVQLACYVAERSLQEYSCIKFLPSIIAAASVHIARKSLKRHPWSPTLLKYTKYDEDDMEACTEEMRIFFNGNAPQQAVLRKYSSPRFGSVAKTTLII